MWIGARELGSSASEFLDQDLIVYVKNGSSLIFIPKMFRPSQQP
jgi:hypothetical protein